MHEFERTSLWKGSLAAQPDDPHSRERERLRGALLELRDNAALAGQTIGRLLPELTVHDVSHADALWGIADEIVGEKVSINPVEAFVLGAAFYIHDLALGLAAFPDGPEALRDSAAVRDVLSAQLFRIDGRWPTREDLDSVDEPGRNAALFEVLRREHAKRAGELLDIAIPHPADGQPLFLLPNSDLRERYGELIGVIAHSHGWEVDDLRRKLLEPRGGPGWATQWNVDRLTIACLLRLADAAHLDERRAPALLAALGGEMSAQSKDHWLFQRRLQPARLKGDRLEFSSASGFPPDEAPAWWLCFEALSMVDGELRQVDAMLSDLSKPRLAARGVAGVDAPARLTAYVATNGWEPVDAQVHVFDVARLVRQLGGEELYGKDATVPLRELIQNSADAVRARRICENRGEEYGSIVVRLGGFTSEQGSWIEVEDDGLGMSTEVMQRYLLNFGTSYWSSETLPYDFPELVREGFVPTGRYGIGFFSIFMWGERAMVTTRRCDLGQADTQVLEFNSGVGQRPIVRPASAHERLRDGGTRIRVWLSQEILESLLPAVAGSGGDDESEKEDVSLMNQLTATCASLAPALDVSLDAEVRTELRRVLTGGDWTTIPPAELYSRLPWFGMGSPDTLEPDLVLDESGTVVGRAAIGGHSGIAVIGGLRAAELNHVSGVFWGAPIRAARDICMPLASVDSLCRWANLQAEQAAEKLAVEDQLETATTVRAFGGSVRGLPIARAAEGVLTFEAVVQRLSSRSAVRLLQDAEVSMLVRDEEVLILSGDVLCVSKVAHTALQFHHGGELVNWPTVLAETPDDPHARSRTMVGAVIDAAAEAWKVSSREVLVGRSFIKDEIGFRDGEPLTAGVEVVMRPGSRVAIKHQRLELIFELLREHESQRAGDLAAALDVSPSVVANLLKPYLKSEMLKKTNGAYEFQ